MTFRMVYVYVHEKEDIVRNNEECDVFQETLTYRQTHKT